MDSLFQKQRCIFFSLLITFYCLLLVQKLGFLISWTSLSPVSVKIASYFANSTKLCRDSA